MLDEYGLRLLAEIGVDVYVPRPAAGSGESAAALAPPAVPVSGAAQPSIRVGTDVLILGSAGLASRLLDDLLRAFRMSGLRAGLSRPTDAAALDEARNLLVLGEAMARDLGAGMPAQRQNAINWIISSEPAALAASASAKQGLWGEIKRLSRLLHAGELQS